MCSYMHMFLYTAGARSCILYSSVLLYLLGKPNSSITFWAGLACCLASRHVLTTPIFFSLFTLLNSDELLNYEYMIRLVISMLAYGKY